MECPLWKSVCKNPASRLRGLVFFALFYVAILFEVQTKLIWHGGGVIRDFPVFFTDWPFFQKYMGRVGGPVEYAAGFLSDFLRFNWAGALVLTLVAWLIAACVGAILDAMGAGRLRCVRFVPAILLLTSYVQYSYRFETTLGFAVALLFAAVYMRAAPGKAVTGVLFFAVLSTAAYYAAGGAYFLFALLAVFYELLFARRWGRGVAFVIIAAAPPFVEGLWLLRASWIDVFTRLTVVDWRFAYSEYQRLTLLAFYVMWSLVPVVMLGVGLYRFAVGLPGRGGGQELEKKDEQSGKRGEVAAAVSDACGWRRSHPKVTWLSGTLAIIAVAAGAAYYSRDVKTKAAYEVDYYACNGMWNEVLEAARRGGANPYVIHEVNRALYHTGRLASAMFAYPQHPAAFFLSGQEQRDVYWQKFGTHMELGLLNPAENNLMESLEQYGTRPVLMRRLALLNIVKGNIPAARVYLNVLSKTLFDAGWAKGYLRRLAEDETLSGDEEVAYFRSVMLEKDYGFSSYSVRQILTELLERNPKNRMAFEYLMGWCMLTGRLEELVKNIARLDDFGYERIPPLWEQAILVHASVTKTEPELGGRKISDATKGKLAGFVGVAKLWGVNTRATHMVRAREYGDTYFYYYNYGFAQVDR